MRIGPTLLKDLTFPAAAVEFNPDGKPEMAIYKPAGDGPFPAVVVHHTCGGLTTDIRTWAGTLLARGYVVMVLDNYTQRGYNTHVCIPVREMNIFRATKDAYQALVHLKTFAFVDKTRIAHAGYSWGATVGALLVSNQVAKSIWPAGDRFDAVASFYPLCYFGGTPQIQITADYLREDTDKPLLVLMGEDDNETPPPLCLTRLEKLKEKSAPVEWHLYPATTHCWDCAALHNFRKRDFMGNNIVYRYSKETTDDSVRRMFEFFAKAMPAKK